ncbi:tetratricopeptide repeat protein [Microbulbifer sp. TYP-18]|uniref:tetratricopeptide repeat protein n=1 Tax=Microbulbifer sp. TYP-18 TaxID=3230024 RepID=UPI0034C6731B
MNRWILLLGTFMVASFKCVGKERNDVSFEGLIAKHCKVQSAQFLSKEVCNLEELENDVKKFFLDEGHDKELSATQLEILVLKLGVDDYSLVLADKYRSEGRPCEAKNVVDAMLNQDSAYLYTQGIYYYQGVCVEPDLETAYSFFKKAARMGHLDSAYNIALMNYFGKGVEQNIKFSAELFAILSAFEHAKSKNFVNYLIDNNYADRKNFSDAVTSRKPLYELNKKRDSKVVLAGDQLKRFLLEGDINEPIPFDSLLAPIDINENKK